MEHLAACHQCNRHPRTVGPELLLHLIDLLEPGQSRGKILGLHRFADVIVHTGSMQLL